jgi:hypothetical protein
MQERIVYVLKGKRLDFYDCWVQDIFWEESAAEKEADRLNKIYHQTTYYVEPWTVS